MKRGIMKTALTVVMAAVVALCVSLPAYAMSGEFAGSSLLFTYYDVRSAAAGGLGLTDNYFTVTNTATDRWVQAHVRIRTGSASIELLDFDILMSPTDVFAFDLYEDNGATVFASCDTKTLINSGFVPNFDRNRDGTNDCFVLDSTTFPAMLSLIQLCYGDESAATSLARTKKGYVEIIGEGVIRANNYYTSAASKDKCRGLDGVIAGTPDDDVLVAGKLLQHCTSDTLSLNDVCPSDIDQMESVLIGRQYYATVGSLGSGSFAQVTRLAQLNAEVMDDENAPLTLHCESFPTEAASSNCVGADQGPCYAYIAATTGDTVVGGADDMNHCLYVSKSLVANDIANKFGAAATFGPTIADIQEDGQRTGTLAQTASALEYIMSRMNKGYDSYNGRPESSGNKQYADSHYFAVPAPGIYDMSTSFAFIFPLQHFIGEKDLISLKTIWDNEENRQVIDIGKFLSPGLPSPTSPGEEASLFRLVNSPFAEGWVRFAITAINSTDTCTETVADTTSCEVAAEVAQPVDYYVPAYTGAVFTTGAQHISASHFQFNRDGSGN